MKTLLLLIVLAVAVATIKESKLINGFFYLYDEKGEKVGHIKKSKLTDDLHVYDNKGERTGILFEDSMDRITIEKGK